MTKKSYGLRSCTFLSLLMSSFIQTFFGSILKVRFMGEFADKAVICLKPSFFILFVSCVVTEFAVADIPDETSQLKQHFFIRILVENVEFLM
jgi:hypothetical protein